MNDLPEMWRRGLRHLIALLLLALLAACGPGGGGTGTGPLALLFSGTQTLSTGASVVGGVPVPAVPPITSRFDLNLQNQSVELTTDCGRFVFTGDWNVNAAGTIVLRGRFELSGSSTAAT